MRNLRTKTRRKNYPDQLDEYRKEMTENSWDFGQDDEELFELADDRQYRDYKSGIAKKRFEDGAACQRCRIGKQDSPKK